MNAQKIFGVLAKYFENPEIHEIIVDAPDDVYWEEKGQIKESASVFKDASEIEAVITSIFASVGRKFEDLNGYGDCRLEDGTRVAAVLAPLSIKGPALVIRKMPSHHVSFDDLKTWKAIDEDGEKIISKLLLKGKNILMAGNTGSGKTTMTNVMVGAMDPAWRLVTVEKTAELHVDRKRAVCLETEHASQEELSELIKKSAHLRGDYIVINELLGAEAFEAVKLMRDGPSILATIPAESASGALSRVELLCMMGQYGLGISEVRSMVGSSVEAVVYQERREDGTRKVSHIALVEGLDHNGKYNLKPLFTFDEEDSSFNLTNAGKKFLAS
ncbi:MAG: CpaF family protein [Halobacteriovoraceae bacterium]|jgi:pilus assembly protein CpaF|nr:CpaF family protein [Halobacteriovoraceae bacterium]MBT5094267.1 CpaF family protein [Halobacteriovoraceae bacterium]